MIPEKLLKPYNPKETEERIYKLWEESGFFNPDSLPTERYPLNAKRFSIVMPPTNANGSLHAGHGLVMAVEDIMIRYKRMRGYKTLWLPGLDHAGFETQVVYEKQLEKEGRSRFAIEPKKLYEEILDFTLNNSANIKSQVRKMGASCDWSREKFTLDPDIVKTVYTTFKKLGDDGLIYRGNRIVSWCPKHQTSFSDLEIEDVEKTEPFYYLKYGPFTISTSRPETKFGDKYVVMHPKDNRYEKYKDGQKIELEWISGKITATVVKDEVIDMEFGTGVMTITPWHDPVDFEISERHGLLKEQIIDERGKLLPIAGEFAGMSIVKARPLVVEKLKAKGLLEKVDEKYKHVVRTCYKCGTTIEPQIRNQWFIKMKPLAEKALQKINAGEITYIPEHYKKITVHWLENIRDWNISRQIVWGIPIPAKICAACGSGFIDLENKIGTCEKCGGELTPDKDTFDTWFSSGQWPFAVLEFPDGNDFKNFYPTDVMETAGEIIFFWVARMIMLGLYITGKVPFKIVYLHGLVLDAKGQKMSKSKGNVINPLDLTAKYGTDAFRMGLVIGNTPGTSLALSEDKIRAYKHFANKFWNIARFVIENTEGETTEAHFTEYSPKDAALQKELQTALSDVTVDMDAYRFYLAAEKLYHYAWHNLADRILEESKDILKNASLEEKRSRKQFLIHTLDKILRALHPFIPFVTEEIWQLWKQPTAKEQMLMVAEWPTAAKGRP
ncbi:MAG TPA: valine--tRNA ligase [Candidatus Taylorbacteria bacterium]|uniref:Valine--tRNA ligase n=1 Tax=Candidatus Kaiserbacteria bacterium GW2011_GWA2_49_56 TaxID=1618670 RepID=A0A0G1VSC8_9BACT|nr:MAG: Valyl-tRNA synthetase [Parcubacteria group bacterium GW2011_GWC2_48_17]KKW09423.1 MAG: Valyl-tRNA synthetase [Candidatus Kaiserbacteria bacterium GW2011_GWA2_49_56]HBV01301.1 valine--tRNA ligase [Candidatus Taylorbacteria bacterium]